MARQLKWRLQFKSLNNTGCLINIYEKDYTGSGLTASGITGADVPYNTAETGVTMLKGAASPFEIQEDNSTNMLDFVRIKTGYINVIEDSSYGLIDLMPNSIDHHYVEAFYGTELVFTGYMKCEEFSDPWVAAPRELSFPVISPLGLLSSYNFATPQSEPSLVTLGSLLREVLMGVNPSHTGNGSNYQNVVYPKYIVGQTSYPYKPWDEKMHSTVVCPFNDGFRHYDALADLYAPKDYKYFIEGLCSCFGWQVHDTPQGPVFTKFEQNTGNTYVSLTIPNLINLSAYDDIPSSEYAIGSYYSNADDHATHSVVRALREVVIELDGSEIPEAAMNTKQTTVARYAPYMSGGTKCWPLEQVGPSVGGIHLGIAAINGSGNLNAAGLFPVAFGQYDENSVQVGVSEAWVMRYSSSWQPEYPILTTRFFGIVPRGGSGYDSLLKIKVKMGTTLKNMKDTDYGDINIALTLRNGNKYYNFNNRTYSDEPVVYPTKILGSTGKVQTNTPLSDAYDDVDGIMFTSRLGDILMNDTIELQIYVQSSTSIPDNNVLQWEISITNPQNGDKAYESLYTLADKIVRVGSSRGIESKSVKVPFYNYDYYYSKNKFTGITTAPSFQYMFRPMDFIEQRMRKSAATSFNEYVQRYRYWVNGWRWRLIAKSFVMVDDEYKLLLARSSVLE